MAYLELHKQQVPCLGQAAEEGKDVAVQVEGEVTHACDDAAHDDHQDGCGDLVCRGSLPDNGLRKCDCWGCVCVGGRGVAMCELSWVALRERRECGWPRLRMTARGSVRGGVG